MALPAACILEINTGGGATNGCVFDPSNANMATDLAATAATGNSPVVTSASYNFAAGDVGKYLFVKAGTNWTAGWYLIASVASNAATLSAAVGAAAGTDYKLNTVAGCATVASPTGGTWTIDYSRSTSGLAVTSITTAAANAILLTAAATVAWVGNGIWITGGTNFTTGLYCISSVSAGVSATVDRNATSAAGVSGTANMGGGANDFDTVYNLMSVGGDTWAKKGSLTISADRTTPTGTVVLPIRIMGYNSVRGDLTIPENGGTWAATHLAKQFLDTTNFPTIAFSGSTLTLGAFTQLAGFNITSAVADRTVKCSNDGAVVYRCKIGNTSNSSSAAAISSTASNTESGIIDCDLSSTNGSGGYTVVGNPIMIANRVTSTNGGGVSGASNNAVAYLFNIFYAMASNQDAIHLVNNYPQHLVLGNTFDNIAGNCIAAHNAAWSIPQIIVGNNYATNCGTFLNNLRSSTQLLTFFGFNNAFRNVTTKYTGWYNNSASMGDVTLTGSDATEYVSQSTQDFRLLYASLGVGAGLPYGLDIGALQRKENLPAASNVKAGVAYGQDNTAIGTASELTGTEVPQGTWRGHRW